MSTSAYLDPSFPETQLDTIEQLIRTSREAFDSNLDQALDCLREIRKAMNGVGWEAESFESLACGQLEYFQNLLEALTKAHARLDKLGANHASAGLLDSELALLGTIADSREAAEQAARKLTLVLDGNAPIDDVTSAETPNIQKAVQRSAVATSKLMATMQLRDNVDQRLGNMLSAISIARSSKQGTQEIFRMVLSALSQDLCHSVHSFLNAATIASEKILSALNEAEGFTAISDPAALPRALRDYGLESQKSELAQEFHNAQLGLMCGPWIDADHGTALCNALNRSREPEDLKNWACFEIIRRKIDRFLTKLNDAACCLANLKVDCRSELKAMPNTTSVSDAKAMLERLSTVYTVDEERKVHQAIVAKLAK